jgi:hypothetical protein
MAEVDAIKMKGTAESRTTDGSKTLDVLKDALLDWLSLNEVTDSFGCTAFITIDSIGDAEMARQKNRWVRIAWQ